jgi:Protein of unknown function (DUF3592)
MVKKKRKTSEGYNTLRNRLGHFIIGGLLVIAGPLLSFFAWQSVKEGRASATWPTAKGKITEAKLWETTDRSGLHFETKVRYTFVVDGKTYNGERLKIGGKSTSDLAEAEADMQRYGRLDAPMEVRYDPSDPSRCTLETGATTGNFIAAVAMGPAFLVGGLVLVGVGVLMTLMAKKKDARILESDDDDDEERPRSRKPKRRADDEDEKDAPPPKKKKRPAADEDEDDERPRKRKSR